MQQADKVFITTAKGTENTLTSDAFEESEYNIDAVIFFKDDLTLNGDGSLTVVSPSGHGIVSKDDLVVTGGTFIGTGGSGMAQSFSDSGQGIIALRVGNSKANTQITLADANGNTVISHAPKLDFAVVILSTPKIIKGETYTITVGDQSGTFQAS